MSNRTAIRIMITDHDFRRLVKGQTLMIHSGVNPTIEVIPTGLTLESMKDALAEAQLIEDGRNLGVLSIP